jgi:Ca-activated chloride channel family protein
MFDVTVHTVGIGSSFAVALVRTFFGRHDVTAVGTSLNQKLLQELAETTGGTYFHAADEDGLNVALASIDELETIEIDSPLFVDYKDLFRFWILLGTGLIFIGVILEHTIFLRVP